MSNLTISIPGSVLDGIAARARENSDEEICGAILRGIDYPVFNVVKEDQRSRRFRMDSQQQMDIWNEWGREGDLIIYHSHPIAPARPSDEDKWVIVRSPDITFLIFSVISGWFRAYRFVDSAIVQVEVQRTEVSTQQVDAGTVPNGTQG